MVENMFQVVFSKELVLTLAVTCHDTAARWMPAPVTTLMVTRCPSGFGTSHLMFNW